MNKQNCDCRIHKQTHMSERAKAHQIKGMFDKLIRRNFEPIEITIMDRAFGDER